MKIVSNSAISLDGRLNTREGRFTLLGSAHDHARMELLRDRADAVLVGGGTFRNWPHPSLPGQPRATPMWNVVVTRSLDVPLHPEFLAEPRIRPLFLTRAAAVPPDFPADVEGYPGDDLPVPWIVDVLRRRGVDNLLVEAGGDLIYQFLAADALDELYVTLCPLVIGGDTPSLAGGPGFTHANMRRLQLLAAEQVGDELFLRYAVRR
jgi:riboflavin biosynthesis pyrimidine reductase